MSSSAGLSTAATFRHRAVLSSRSRAWSFHKWPRRALACRHTRLARSRSSCWSRTIVAKVAAWSPRFAAHAVLMAPDYGSSITKSCAASEWSWVHPYQAVPQEYLDHLLECPYCLTIRLRIPRDARPETRIFCDDCGKFLGTWDELLTDFERQGGSTGVFRLDKGRIKRID